MRLFFGFLGAISKRFSGTAQQKGNETINGSGFAVYCTCKAHTDISAHMVGSIGSRWQFQCPSCKKVSTFYMGAPVPIPVDAR